MRRKPKSKAKPKTISKEKATTKLIHRVTDIKALEKSCEFVGKPFGFMHEEWTKLKTKLTKDTELWWLVTRKDREYNWGYGIVKDKKVVDKIYIEVSKGDCYGIFAEEKQK